MARVVILIGGGEHARVVAEAVRSNGDAFDLLGFVDPKPCVEMVERLGVQRLGDDSALASHREAYGVLGVGTSGPGPQRASVVRRAGEMLAGWVAIVHRNAWVAPTAGVSPGAVIMAGAIVSSGAKIGAHAVVNTGAVIEHDVVLDDFALVGPGAVLGGAVRVGVGAFVGLGAVIRDHRTIGEGAMVGMGAVVVDDVQNRVTVVGVPARIRSPGTR